MINVSSDYEIYCINNNPYFENEEYVLVNNVLPNYLDEEHKEEYNDNEEYDEYGYGEDDDYF